MTCRCSRSTSHRPAWATPPSPSSSSRGSRARSSHGQPARQVWAPSTLSASRSCSSKPARRRRAGSSTRPSACPTAPRPRPWPSAWATCSGGWSPSAPRNPTRSSVRARSGSGMRGLGRRGHHRAERWSPCCASAGAVRPATPTPPPTRSVGRRRWSTRPASPTSPPRCPARSTAPRPSIDGRSIAKSALTGMVDAICRDTAAARRGARAGPPSRAHAADVAEAFLARLDGSQFDAPAQTSAPSSSAPRALGPAGHRRVTAGPPRRPARPARQRRTPGTSSVLAPGAEGNSSSRSRSPSSTPAPSAASSRSNSIRLERLLPVLRRPGGLRRGEVVLSQDEAWELMTVTGPRLARRRLRRAGARAVAPEADAVAAPARRRRRASRSVGAHQLANVRWSAVFDDVELTAADIARLAKEARPLVRSGGRWVALDHADLRAAAAALAERANTHPAHRRRDAAPRPRPRGLAARRRHLASPAAAGPPTCSRSASTVSDDPAARARGLRRRAAQLPGRGARLARLPRRRRPRRLPRARHGPRQDARRCSPTCWPRAGDGPALVIAPPAVVGNWAAEAAQVHARPPGRRAPRRQPGRRPTRSPPRSRPPTSSSPPTAPPCATSRPSRTIDVGPHRPRRGAGHQEPGQRHRPAAAPHRRPRPRRPHRHADRERPRRPLGHPRLHQPRPGRARGRSSSPSCRATARRRAGAGRGRAAGAQRHPRVPPHQGRAGHRRRAARPHRRARPLRDDARADRPLPGRARPAGHRSGAPRTDAEARKGAVLAAITALKQICNHPVRLPGRRPARSTGARASSPASRRSSTRCSPPTSGC